VAYIHTKFHDEGFRHLKNITVITATIWEAVMLVLLIEGIYAVEMASCDVIYIPSFMKIDTGVQAMSRFCHRNLRGCNICITNGWDL
jgi:hypothetical protein